MLKAFKHIAIIMTVFVLVLSLVACGSDAGSEAPAEETAPTEDNDATEDSAVQNGETEPVEVVLNWFPQPEFGGIYAAQEQGFYEEAGLDVTITPGGPQVSPVQIVAAGQAQFGLVDGDILLESRKRDIPVSAIFATFQENPQIIMYHAGQDIEDFSDLNGRSAFIPPGQAYWDYIVAKYELDDVQLLTYNGNTAGFAADERSVQQGYLTSEPHYLKEEGLEIEYLVTSDSGYRRYNNVLFTTEDMIQENSEVIEKFVKATQRGWEYYLDNPESTNEIIGSLAKGLTEEGMAYSVEAMKPLITEGDAAEHGIGYMTEERWQTLVEQLQEIDYLPNDFNTEGLFTTEFLE